MKLIVAVLLFVGVSGSKPTPNPQVIVTPNNLNPGDPWSITATGFDKHADATLSILGPQTVILSENPDAHGNFTVTFCGSCWPIFPGVPAGGYYTVRVTQGTLQADAALVVE